MVSACQPLLMNPLPRKAAAAGEAVSAEGHWKGRERMQVKLRICPSMDTCRKDVAFSCRTVLTLATGC